MPTIRPEGGEIEVKEIEATRYCVACPNCGEWHEHDESQIKKKYPIECICGAKIRAIP